MQFSEKFLQGLQTKSSRFQSAFFDIMNNISEFLDSDEEIQEFSHFVENTFSYEQRGNILYSGSLHITGKPSLDRKKEYLDTLKTTILDLFLFGDENGILEASHFILAVRFPKGVYTEEDDFYIRLLIKMKHPQNPLTVISLIQESEDRCAEIFYAMMK